MEHIWTKIKSWVNTQLAGKANSSHTHTYSQITDLSSWKTTNFGSFTNSGSINNAGNVTLGANSNLYIDSRTDFIVDTITDMQGVNGGFEIKIPNYIDAKIAITKASGLCIKRPNPLKNDIIINQTNETINICVIYFKTYNSETRTVEVEHYMFSIGPGEELSHSFATVFVPGINLLIFW